MSKQKIIKVGNSLGVTLPSGTVNAMGLKPGDRVEVIQETAETITFRFVDNHQLSLDLSPLSNKDIKS